MCKLLPSGNASYDEKGPKLVYQIGGPIRATRAQMYRKCLPNDARDSAVPAANSKPPCILFLQEHCHD